LAAAARGAGRDTERAMSQENVDLWRNSFESFLADQSEADFDTVVNEAQADWPALWHPDIEWDASESPAPDLAGVYRGKEAVLHWWQEWLSAWGMLAFDYELVDAGDRVVLLVNDQRMEGRSTGLQVETGPYAQIATFKEGLIIHWKLYRSQADALEAAGLSE
jgi:ketosteroid isomerase-like protein